MKSKNITQKKQPQQDDEIKIKELRAQLTAHLANLGDKYVRLSYIEDEILDLTAKSRQVNQELHDIIKNPKV